MKLDGVVSALHAQYASAVRNDKRRKWNGFYVRPQPDLLPRGEGTALFVSVLSDEGSANSVARIIKETADDSPSPWRRGSG